MFSSKLLLIRGPVVAGAILVLFGIYSSRAGAQGRASPTAPTVNEDPAKLDQAWQQASSKYDAPRAELLKEVDRI
ncbi:MAG: hypothetical protein ACREAC_13680, partial [Blastocatellia bacterium]